MKQSNLSYSYLRYVLAFLLLNQAIEAEVLPKDRSFVHSANVYFEENSCDNAVKYQLLVFTDSIKAVHNLAKMKSECVVPSFFSSGFSWGKKYYWQVNAIDRKGKKIHTGALHLFSMVEEVGSPHFDSLKIDIITNRVNKHAGGFLVIDYMRGIYDRSGKLVWKLPGIEGFINVNSEIRDVKFTKDNSITLLSDSRPIEIDQNGNLLWSLPNPFVFMGDTVTFHHDFEKTNRNTYLLLANKPVMRKITNLDADSFKKSQLVYVEKNGVLYTHTEVAIILEVDATGQVLWWWDSGTYLNDVDLNFKKRPDGIPQMQSHANAVGVSDDNSKVFIGYRDLSRVLVIDKKSKQVLISYGEKYPSGEAKWGNTLFNQQHDANPTNRNSFFVFNNNGPRGNFGISSILELTADSARAAEPVLWKFSLDFDTLTKGRSGSGGNINELPNTNILLCAGQLNRIFEVTREKEVVWDGLIYALQKSDGKWHAMPNYRASWVEKVKTPVLYTEVRRLPSSDPKILNLTIRVYDALNPGDSYQISSELTKIISCSVSGQSVSKKEGELLQIALVNTNQTEIELLIRSKSEPLAKKKLTVLNNN